MWMGGYPSVGYDVHDRKLVVNLAEAAQVERIFSLYVELGSVRLLRDRLAAVGITSKQRLSSAGRPSGGLPLKRGNLYDMLQNRLYRGEIAHKGRVYPGEHAAIIGEALWDKVQAGLSNSRLLRSSDSNSDHPSLLTGILFDADSQRLTPTHAKKGVKRYRYYVSAGLVTEAKATVAGGLRLPAGGLDALVVQALLDLMRTPATMLEALGPALAGAVQQHASLRRPASLRGIGSSLGKRSCTPSFAQR